MPSRKLAVPTYAAAVLAACLPTLPLQGATTPKQAFLETEVSRFSKIIGVDVRTHFSEKKLTYGCTPDEVRAWDCHALGWYTPGVANFYIPDLEALTEKQLSDVACHEVAHALMPAHNSTHWCICQKAGATPTYPLPGVPGGMITCQ